MVTDYSRDKCNGIIVLWSRHCEALSRLTKTPILSHTRACAPVSYTHLDVYKRQIQDQAKPGVTATQRWTPSISRKVIKTRGYMHNAIYKRFF